MPNDSHPAEVEIKPEPATTKVTTITTEEKENISSHVQLKYLPSQIQLIHSQDIRQSMNAAHMRTHVRLDPKEEVQSAGEPRGDDMRLPPMDAQTKHVIVKGKL